MESKDNIYSENFKIRAYEIDTKAYVTIFTICNYLQEIAGNHAMELGVGVDKLLKMNLTWVLSRLHLKMDKYPLWRDEINIVTWPSGVNGRFAIRDFEIYDSQNNILGRATTSWMLIDLIKIKPITMPEYITNIKLPDRARAIEDKFEKLPVVEKTEYQKLFHVRLSDLDINNHVNNVNYIEWAIETVPVEIRKKYQISGLEISFRAEGKYGNKILSKSQKCEEPNCVGFHHCIIEESKQTELAIARSFWSYQKQGY